MSYWKCSFLFFHSFDFRSWWRERRPSQVWAGSTLTQVNLWASLLKVKQASFNARQYTEIQNMQTDNLMFPLFLTEFPVPKNELFQRFHVYYLGCEAVAKPVGKKTPSVYLSNCKHYALCHNLFVCFSGMEVINEAFVAAMIGKDKNDWTPVSVNVAPATLTILSEQVTAIRG